MLALALLLPVGAGVMVSGGGVDLGECVVDCRHVDGAWRELERPRILLTGRLSLGRNSYQYGNDDGDRCVPNASYGAVDGEWMCLRMLKLLLLVRRNVLLVRGLESGMVVGNGAKCFAMSI